MSHQSFPKTTGTPTDGYVLTYSNTDGYWAARPVPGSHPAAGWQTVYDVDFAGLPNQSFSGNGNVVIDGKTWTVENFAAATSFGIVNTEGLKFVCNTTNADYNNGTRNSLLIKIPVTNISSLYDLEKCEVRISCQITQNGDQNFEHIFTGFEHATSPTSQNFSLGKGFNSTTIFATKETLNASSTNTTDSTDTSHDVMLTELNSVNEGALRSGLYSGGWPTNTSLRRVKLFTTAGDLPFEKTSDVNIFFTAITVNTSGTFVTTVRRFKVEIRAKGSLNPITAGGDLTGTYPNPTVSKIYNVPVSSAAPTDGYVLTYSGDGYWRPSPPASLVHAFKSVTTDITTSSGTYAEILSQNLTLSRDGYVSVMFTFSGEKTVATGTPSFRLKIDGVVEEEMAVSASSGFGTTGSLVYRKQLLSGAHTFSIEWRVDTNGFRIFASSVAGQHANILISEIAGSNVSSSTSGTIDSNAVFTTVVDNVAGNGTFSPAVVATNWTGNYTADGYSKLLIFGSATGGSSSTGVQITLNLRIDSVTVKSVTRFTNASGIHVAFPSLFYSVVLPAGVHTIQLLQSGTNAFNDANSFASLHVYKIANVTNIGWLATKTSNFVAASADTYIPVDTASSAVTITLPGSPDNGERHIIADVGGLADTNNIIVDGNGHNIIGLSTYIMTGPYNVLEVAYHTGKAIWVII